MRKRSWPLRKSLRRSPNIVIRPLIVQSPANPSNTIGCMARTLAGPADRPLRDVRTGGVVGAGDGPLLVDLERAVRDLDQHAAVLDHDGIDGEWQLGRRVERLAAREVEPGQVQGARQRSGGQEPLVELEV